MPTRQENSLKLGIVAGSGVIPAQLLSACQKQNIQTKIIGFKDCTDKVTPDFWTRIGSSAKTLQYLKSQEIKDIIMIGAVKRPSFFDLWPDWTTFKFFFKAWVNSFGDDSLLKAARTELEHMGFTIHGIQNFMPELLMPEGVLGHISPKNKEYLDIQLGLKESQKLGLNDIGQAVIVKDGKILGREDKRGTSALIRKSGEQGAILVKSCKPQQDKDLDLPTIGPETARLCAQMRMSGIVAQAGNSLLVEPDLVKNIADNNGMFLIGVTINEK